MQFWFLYLASSQVRRWCPQAELCARSPRLGRASLSWTAREVGLVLGLATFCPQETSQESDHLVIHCQQWFLWSEEEKFPQWNHWHPQESSLYPGSRSAGSGHCHKKSHFQAAKLAKTFGMKKGPRLVPRVCCFRGIVYLSEGLWPNKLLHSSHHCGSMRIGQVQQSLKLNIFICFLLYKREK